jgi:Hsp70 protein
MSESLGLSIGVANLVAARAGSAPVIRSSVLTLFDGRPSEVGLPEQNPNLTEPGLVLRGFVERVGDRSPLVAADGTTYLGDALTVEALEAMARAVGYGSPVTIAVPAYWSEGQSAALRNEFFAQPGLAAGGVAPVLISDAAAALAALQTKPGFPKDGFVALCDFGAGGTTVTLTNAGSNFQQIGQSVRYTAFSGEAIDQLVADYVHSGGQDAATSLNVGATARAGSLARLLGECQRAKELLSAGTVTTIATDSGADFRLARTGFEQLISGSLDGVVAAVEEILQANGIPRANLAAVATVGGGASIPLATTRLSERLQVPIITTPEPMVSAALGAAVLGPELQTSAGAATAAGAAVGTPTEVVDMPRTEAAPGALAWSQDTATGQEPVPYTGPEHTDGYGQEPAGSDTPTEERYAAEPGPLPWYKRTALVISVAVAAAAVLVAVLLALTIGKSKLNPANTPRTESPPTSQTVKTTFPNGIVGTTVVSPPPSSATQPPVTTTTPRSSTTTTTTTRSSTTTTTQQTTSSQASTTPTSTTQQTTSARSTRPTRPPA